MLFNVLRELRQAIGAVSEFDLSEPQKKAGDVTIRNLKGAIRILRTHRGLLVRTRATGLIDEVCSRCLTPTESAVTVDFEEEYCAPFRR